MGIIILLIGCLYGQLLQFSIADKNCELSLASIYSNKNQISRTDTLGTTCIFNPLYIGKTTLSIGNSYQMHCLSNCHNIKDNDKTCEPYTELVNEIPNNNWKILPDISARVDTSNVEISKVLHLIKDYLNSRPDSAYLNPYWNADENQKYYVDGVQQCDRSASLLFYDEMTATAFFSIYRPKILQIDKIEDNRYQIKTIYSQINEFENNKSYSPLGITKLYAVKDQEGNYKLENALGYDTRNWKSYQYQMITYKVHPTLKFNKKRASEAMNFCRSVMKKLNINKIEPITYYVTPNSDEMWKLFNFEYMLYYTTGMANSLTREIFTSFGTENYFHELAHLIIPNPDNISKKNSVIITEGLVTWLAGSQYNSSFSNALAKLSDKLNRGIHPTLEEIITCKYRNIYNSDVLYVTGGVICKLAYEQSGLEGVFELYNCPDDLERLKRSLEKVFKMQYPQIEKMVINYIVDYKYSR